MFAYLFFLPISIVAVPFAFAVDGLPDSIPTLVFVGIIVTAPTTLIFWGLLRLSQRIKVDNSFSVNVTIITLTGVIRGAIFYFVIDTFNYENPTSLLGKIITSTFTVILWVGIASVLVESNRRFGRKYRALLTQIMVTRLRYGATAEPGYAYLAQHMARMQLKIKSSIEDARELPEAKGREKLIAESLREEIEEEIKPLSQRLWIKSIFDPPSLSFGAVLRTSITELGFKFHLIALLYSAAIFMNTTQIIGHFAGILFGMTTYFVFFVADLLRHFSINRLKINQRAVNYTFIVTVGLFVGIGTQFLFQITGFNYSYSVSILLAPALPVLIIAASYFQLAISDRKSLIEQITRSIKPTDQNSIDKYDRRNAASYLHNSLQSELTALAFQLEKLANNPDYFSSRIVMEKLDTLVSQSRSEDFKNFLESPKSRLDRVLESWEGIIEVEHNFDPEIFTDSSRSSLVVQLVQEAIANAVRAGKAKKIRIESALSPDAFVLKFIDNGYGPLGLPIKGIGSMWIDQIAISDWDLRESDQGRVLTVEI
jgi:signal transduction histidine kinase